MTVTTLSETKVNRSAYAVKTAEATTVYMGHCDRHDLPVREAKLGLEPELAPRTSLVLCFHDPAAEHEIIGEKLVAVTTSLDCDPACKSARRNACSCGCGGVLHGLGWSRQFKLDQREMYESQVQAYRDEQVKLAEQREARTAGKAERERNAFESWVADNAEIIGWLTSLEDAYAAGGGFLFDMQAKVRNAQILSDNMMRVVIKIKGEAAKREARQAERAQREAERAARGAGNQDELVPGVYKLGDAVYVVKPNREYIAWRKHSPNDLRPSDARLYAKRLVESCTRKTKSGEYVPAFRLDYAPGVIFRVVLADRLPLEEARELSQRFRCCIYCGHTLDDPKSIAKGVGTECVKYFGAVLVAA